MPQYIEFNGETVEFPDEMNDKDIESVLQGQEQPAQERFKAMSGLEQAASVAGGTIESIGSMMSTIPAYAAAGGAALSALAQGEDIPTAVDVSRGVAEEFTYKPRTAGGQILMDEYLGPAFEKIKDIAGIGLTKLGAEVVSPFVGGSRSFTDKSFRRDIEADIWPITQTLGEVLVDAPMLVLPVRSAGARVKQSKTNQIELQKAQQIFDEAMAAEQNIAKSKAEEFAYKEGYEQLDATMMRYPKDYQAPQYGMGGKVARIPDQAKAQRPVSDQVRFDEDMRMLYEQEAKRSLQEQDIARSIQFRPIPVEGTFRQEHMVDPSNMGPKEHLRGPSAIARDMVEVEVAQKMAEREKIRQAAATTQRIIPDRIIPDDALGATGYKTPGFNQKLHESQTGMRWNGKSFVEIPTSARKQLETIRDSSEIPYYRELSKLLLADKSFNPKVEIADIGTIQALTKQRSTAAYKPNEYKTIFSLQSTGQEAVVLHEFIHAATYGAIEGVREQRATAKHLQPSVERLQGLYASFRDLPREHAPYGLLNIHEFIAEGFTNPEFQASLARVKFRKGSIKTYWDKFVEAIGQALGFDRNTNNYLSELMRVGAEIIEGSTYDVRRLYDFSSEGLQGLPGMELREFKQILKDRDVKISDVVAKSIWEKSQAKPAAVKAHPSENAIPDTFVGASKIQKQYADNRTLEQVASEISQMPKDNLLDFAAKNTVDKIIQGRFIAKGNPLLSWTSSRIHWTKQESIAQANVKLHGENRKTPDVGTANYMWTSLSTESKQAVRAVTIALRGEETWLGARGIQAKSRELLGRDLTNNELKSYLDRNRIAKEVLEDFNLLQKAEGRAPIRSLPHYGFPSVFDGSFKVLFKNDRGETVKVADSYIRPNMEKLRKAFPEYKLVEIADKGLKGDIDWTEFEWILRQLDKEQRDPAAKAIEEGLRRLGFRKHGLQRKGAAGARGTEGGRKGLRNYEEIYERYIRQAYDYMANRQLDKIFQELNGLKEADHLPYTKAYALEAIDAARGGSNKTFDYLSRTISAAINGTITIGTGGKLQLPQRFTRDLIRVGNKMAYTMLLGFWHPVFIGAQLLQAATFLPPKLLAMAAESGFNTARVFSVLAKSTAEYSKWDRSMDARKLKQVGAFDSTFQYDWSTYAGDSRPHYKRTVSEHLTGLSTLMWVESNAVRRPSAHMFLEMLREIGYEKISKDPMEIYKVAREMTDHYMVSMRFYEKPHVFSRTGLFGMSVSPLQSFATTYLGMLREYTKLSAQGLLEGSVAKQLPLASFMAVSLMTSGMLGIVGVKEWDVLAEFLNKHFGMNVPTGSEWILSTFKSDKMRFGLLTDTLGYAVGTTFSAPTLAGNFAPGLQFIQNLSTAIATIPLAAGVLGEENIPTTVKMRDATKGVTPRFSPLPGFNWGDIERLHTLPGQPYAEKSGKAGPYTRTEKDWQARRFGTYTKEEFKNKAEYYAAQKLHKKMEKPINRIVDILLSGKGQESLPILWKSLQDDQFTENEIHNAMRREIVTRMTEGDVRALGRGQTPTQQRLWMLHQLLSGDKK